MWENIFYFIMVPMVYLAFATLAIGIAFKLVIVFRSPNVKGSLGVFPRERLRLWGILKESLAVPAAYRKSRLFWFFIMAYHIAFVLLVLGHLELVWDIGLIHLIPHEVFLGSGAVGITLIASVLYFFFRRFKSPYREISVPEDYLLLLLLFLAFFFGSHLHLADRFGMEALHIPVEEYRAYLSSLVSFDPRLPVMITASPLFIILILHLFFANLFLMLFPFSKMIHSVFVFFALHLKRK